MQNNNVGVSQFEDIIKNKKIAIGLIEGEAILTANSSEAMSTSASYNTDDAKKSLYKNGQSIYVDGINDSVDINTGALSYSVNICNIKGLNGLDLNLTLRYNSIVQSKFYTIDTKYNLPSNWTLSLPYIDVVKQNCNTCG